jgi:hypothetical protein
MLRIILFTMGWAAVGLGTFGLFKASRILHLADGSDGWNDSTALAVLGLGLIVIAGVVR